MKHVDILVQLVKSLSKAEKRVFRLSARESSDYMLLFDLIDREGYEDVTELKEEYSRRNEESAFNVAVNYLYRLLLEKLVSVRINSLTTYQLTAECLKARVLFEKSLYPAALDILEKVKRKARATENFEILLSALRLELDYLQYLKMPEMSEVDLNKKHMELSDAVEKLTYLNEQSKLYELIEHKLIYKGNPRSEVHMHEYDELFAADQELYKHAGISIEAKRRHLLLQALYFTAKGEVSDALKASTELNELISMNPHLAENPLYYIRFIHNLLDNLRDAGEYDKMPEYIEGLRSKQYSSEYIRDHVMAITDLYQLIVFVDHGEFQKASQFISECESFRIAGTQRLHVAFEARILLYMALTHIGMGNFREARRALSKSKFSSQLVMEFPIFPTIRLTNLIVHYKMNDSDYINAQARSLKREMANKNSSFSMELLLLKVMLKGASSMASQKSREKLWKEIEPQIRRIKEDPYESRALYLFDFAAWLESEITRRPLSELLRPKPRL